MALRTFSGNYDGAGGLGSERSVSMSGSGSIGNTISSIGFTIGLSTNSYSKTYNIRVKVSDGYNYTETTIPCKLDGTNYTQAYFGGSLAKGSVNWSSSYLTIYLLCTSTSSGGSASDVFIKGGQTVSVNSTSASDFTLDSSSVTVGNTITANLDILDSSNYHMIQWYINNTNVNSSWIFSGYSTGSYQIAASDMQYITSSTSASSYCRLTTYTSGGSQIGYIDHYFTTTVPNNDTYKPSFTLSAVTPNNTKLNTCIAGYSTASITLSSVQAGLYGSISGAIGSCTGISSTNISISSGSGIYTTSTLYTSGTNTITVTVTDSRGRTTTKTAAFIVNPYNNPVITSCNIFRCDSSGNILSTGTYVKVIMTYNVGSSFSGANAITSTVVSSKLNSATTYTNVYTTPVVASGGSIIVYITGGYLITKSYDMKFTITDTFGTSISTIGHIYSSSNKVLDLSPGTNSVGLGADVSDVSNRVVINANWDLYYKGSELWSQAIAGTTASRGIIYSSSQPTGQYTGQIWLKPTT